MISSHPHHQCSPPLGRAVFLSLPPFPLARGASAFPPAPSPLTPLPPSPTTDRTPSETTRRGGAALLRAPRSVLSALAPPRPHLLLVSRFPRLLTRARARGSSPPPSPLLADEERQRGGQPRAPRSPPLSPRPPRPLVGAGAGGFFLLEPNPPPSPPFLCYLRCDDEPYEPFLFRPKKTTPLHVQK
jgi:hypothetical protein